MNNLLRINIHIILTVYFGLKVILKQIHYLGDSKSKIHVSQMYPGKFLGMLILRLIVQVR
jgi:hypothetical protein